MTLWTLLQVSIVMHVCSTVIMLCYRHKYLHATLRSSCSVIVQAVLLFANGLAILNNERFLEPCKSEMMLLCVASLGCC